MTKTIVTQQSTSIENLVEVDFSEFINLGTDLCNLTSIAKVLSQCFENLSGPDKEHLENLSFMLCKELENIMKRYDEMPDNV